MELLNGCIYNFQRKIEDLDQEELERISDCKEKLDYNLYMAHPEEYFERPLSQYIYKDKDDGYENRTDELNLPVQAKIKSKNS